MIPQLDLEKLAQMIKINRGKLGYLKLSRKIGTISSSSIHKVETGSTPSLETYILLCEWLNVPLDYFYYRYQNNVELTDKDSLIKFVQSDKTLNPDNANALAKMIELTYA